MVVIVVRLPRWELMLFACKQSKFPAYWQVILEWHPPLSVSLSLNNLLTSLRSL